MIPFPRWFKLVRKQLTAIPTSVSSLSLATQSLRSVKLASPPESRAIHHMSTQVAVGGQSLVCMINFTTTRAGLTGQLLGRALHLEKPELEQRKSDLLKQEEELKIQISNLEDTLLDQLNASTGNILENKELLDSLNQTKSKSATIETSLKESTVLQENLEKEGNIYLPLAEFASKLYFVIKDLSKINQMYQFSQVTNDFMYIILFSRQLTWLSMSEPSRLQVLEELTQG